GVGPRPRPGWEPLDSEPDFRAHTPAVEVPDVEAVRATIAVPDLPLEIPAAARLLEQQVAQPLDPWELELPHPHPAATGRPGRRPAFPPLPGAPRRPRPPAPITRWGPRRFTASAKR